jgi:hypothetical protein
VAAEEPSGEAAAEVSDDDLTDEEPENLKIELVEEESFLLEGDGEGDGDGDGDGDGEDDEEPRAAGFDRRPDVYSWILVPVATLVLGPAIAASITFFVAESANDYPSICSAVRFENGCEEIILRMTAEHAAAFLVCWVLLWALP